MPDIVLLGLPYDLGSSHIRGAAGGPSAIRAKLFDPCSNAFTEAGLCLTDHDRFRDDGDLALPEDPAEAMSVISAAVAARTTRGDRILALGGDHAVTFPAVRGLIETSPSARPLNVVQIDAHPDLYAEFNGDRYSHACGFARIKELGPAVATVTQVGIRAMTAHQREQAERFNVQWSFDPPASWPTGPTYVSVDLDGLDPACAPGVAHPEPGGLTTREVLRIIQTLPGPIVGADVVELVPRLDQGTITAIVAAKIVKELAGRMVSSLRSLEE